MSLTPPKRRDIAGDPGLVLSGLRRSGGGHDQDEPAFVAAVRLYERRSWTFAYDRLTALADDRHVSAARLALLMLRYGASVYEDRFSARPEQIARWARLVIQASTPPGASGSPSGRDA